MTSIVDTHCHLDLEAFDEDRSEMFDRALRAGVHAMVLVGYNPERWATTGELREKQPYLTRTLGIHPNDADLWNDDIAHKLGREVDSSRPVAIGEIGLDFYRSKDNSLQQKRAFVAQLELAADLDLPVVIHQRDAEEEVLNLLESVPVRAGVMHCFTGDVAFAERCLDLGFYLGIGGVLTFRRSDEIREAVRQAPFGRLVLETDAPFLAPQPQRGKRNEPAFLTMVIAELAHIRGVTEDDIVRQTTQNAIELFGESITRAIAVGLEQA